MINRHPENHESTHLQRYGKSPDIGFSEVPRPTLKADDLLVQVHAASVNPTDNMIPTGIFKPVLKFGLPATLGSDLAGARCFTFERAREALGYLAQGRSKGKVVVQMR